jgi:hypothetical protein
VDDGSSIIQTLEQVLNQMLLSELILLYYGDAVLVLEHTIQSNDHDFFHIRIGNFSVKEVSHSEPTYLLLKSLSLEAAIIPVCMTII